MAGQQPDDTAARASPAIRLNQFLKDIWWIVEPENPFTDSWHIRALCEHIEALYCGYTRPEDGAWVDDIERLIVNIPPGFTKSIACSIATPCWLWTFRPSFRWLLFSYHDSLSNDLATKRRSVLTSQYFRSNWPIAAALSPYTGPTVSSSHQRKTRDTIKLIENVAGGRMFSTVTGGGVTGQHPHGIIGDDPVQPPDGEELLRADPAQMRKFRQWWRSKASTRGYADDVRARVMLVMQRVAIGDPSEVLLEEGDCEHLMLPMQYDPDHKVRDPKLPTRLGFVDPRSEPGELLCEQRVSLRTVEKITDRLRSHNAAAQLQQDPQKAEGQMFRHGHFQYIAALPPDDPIAVSARHWDLAATHNAGDYTCGVRVDRLQSGRFVISNVVRGQWDVGERDLAIRAAAQRDGVAVAVGLEREPGSGGKAQVAGLTKTLSGFSVHEVPATKSKDVRAQPLASQMQIGNVWVLSADWNEAFERELTGFPGGRNDDQVDAASGAFHLVAVVLADTAIHLTSLSDEEQAELDQQDLDSGRLTGESLHHNDIDVADESFWEPPGSRDWRV